MTNDTRDDDLGAKITQAASFVQDVYGQIQGLLYACDACFEKVGLVPISAEVELDAQRNIGAPKAWCQPAVGRLYVPKKRFGGKATHLLIVEVHLIPTIASHAVLVLALATPKPPLTPKELVSAFHGGQWAETLLKGLYPAQTEFRGMREQHPDLLQVADALYVKAWPLVEISDERLVEDVLGAQIKVWGPVFPQ